MPGALPADGPGNALWAPMPPAVPPLRPSWPQFVSSCSALSVHPSSAPSPSLGLRGLRGFLVPPPAPLPGPGTLSSLSQRPSKSWPWQDLLKGRDFAPQPGYMAYKCQHPV